MRFKACRPAFSVGRIKKRSDADPALRRTGGVTQPLSESAVNTTSIAFSEFAPLPKGEIDTEAGFQTVRENRIRAFWCELGEHTDFREHEMVMFLRIVVISSIAERPIYISSYQSSQ